MLFDTELKAGKTELVSSSTSSESSTTFVLVRAPNLLKMITALRLSVMIHDCTRKSQSESMFSVRGPISHTFDVVETVSLDTGGTKVTGTIGPISCSAYTKVVADTGGTKVPGLVGPISYSVEVVEGIFYNIGRIVATCCFGTHLVEGMRFIQFLVSYNVNISLVFNRTPV